MSSRPSLASTVEASSVTSKTKSIRNIFARTESNISSIDHVPIDIEEEESEGKDEGGGKRDGIPDPENMLRGALQDAARMAFGVYAVEAWAYNEDTSQLISIGGGLHLHLPPQDADDAARDALDRIINPEREDYVSPVPKSPGVGLAGVLWTESTHETQFHVLRKKSDNDGAEKHVVVWRQVDALANDPDQPYEERLQLLAKAGFRLAAGIPFDVRGHKGIVTFYANPFASREKLRHPANETYMCYAAELIGATAAISKPLKNVTEMRQKFRDATWRRLKLRMITVVRFGGALNNLNTQDQSQSNGNSSQKPKLKRQSTSELIESCATMLKDHCLAKRDDAQRKISQWNRKCKGGNVKLPPPMPTEQALWTFFGVFVTHLILSRIHQLVKDESGGEYTLVLAPLGAFTTLQYNLTAAPASQPRNAFLAQILSTTVSMSLTYIPNLDIWVRSAVAPAIVIPAMARFGIIHPPAGAASVVFASGALDWVDVGIFMAAVSIAIITGVAINNMSDKRQYPTSWVMINSGKDLFHSGKGLLGRLVHSDKKSKEREEDEAIARETVVADKSTLTGISLRV